MLGTKHNDGVWSFNLSLTYFFPGFLVVALHLTSSRWWSSRLIYVALGAVQAFFEDQDVGGDLGTSFHSPGLLG